MPKRISLGRMAVFLLPVRKLKRQFNETQTVEEMVHEFLMIRYNGYTVSEGNTSGHWRDENGQEYSGEHRVYRASFVGKERIPELESFLTALGRTIHERYIYLETGEDAWLIDTAE